MLYTILQLLGIVLIGIGLWLIAPGLAVAGLGFLTTYAGYLLEPKTDDKKTS